MLNDRLYRYEPTLLGLAFCIAIIYTSIQGISTHSQLSDVRRKLFLVLLFVSNSIYLTRAGLIVAAQCASEKEIIPALSQALLQCTVLLSFLASEAPSLSPYLLVWLTTLSVEIYLIVFSTPACHVTKPLVVSLSMTNIVLLTLLSCSAFFISQTDPTNSTAEERQPLLADGGQKSKSRSSAGLNPQSERSRSSVGCDNDSESASDSISISEEFDSDDDEETIKKIRKQRLQEPGGVFRYCLSYKVFIPFIIPSKNPKLLFYTVVVIFNTGLERVLNILGPYLLGRAIQKMTDTRQFPPVEVVLYVLVTVLTVDFCGLAGMNDALLERLKAWSRQTLVVTAFDRIMSLSADFHDDKDSGEVIKAVEQAESLSELFHTITVEFLPGILDLFIAMWYVGYLFGTYATLIVVTVAIAFFFSTLFATRPLRRTRRVAAKAERHESELLYETIGNWSIVSYFNRRQYEVGRINNAAGEVAATDVRSNDFKILMFASQEASERLGQMAILLLAAWRVATGKSSIGDFVTMERYWSTISQPLYIMGHTFRQFASNLIDAERLLQLFDVKIAVQDRSGAQPLKATHGQIEFSHVNFAYKTSKTVIQDLSFTVQPGQSVAFVGATGSGKSTISKLLLRMYDLNGGTISIDGQDISGVTMDSLRQCFGLVPQDNVLFNTTILENVRYGRLDATDEEVRAVCEAARIHKKILSLPAGYHTRVGEKGVKLSGGERQRIAVARVLLKRPQIVVLDEATSAMDTQTEMEVHEALNELTRNRTSVIIAHRLSTIVHADIIMVVDDGCLVEQGTHAELLKSSGRYHDLWESQIAADASQEQDRTKSELL